MIIREEYLKQIRPFYDSDLIKVITGIRRCGKSVILQTIMEEIYKQTDNIIYLNFEKSNDYEKASTKDNLINYIMSNKKEGKCYIFLDEIQEIENWWIAIKDLRLENTSIFITGSNSKLLSSEFITLLSGRFVSFRIRPFVYKEILQFDNSITELDYLVWGGFPGSLGLKDVETKKSYLYDLENTIVINDIIKRFNIKKDYVFKKIVIFILKNNARIFSARNIYRYIKNEGIEVSLNTVIKYITYLKDGYIIDEISRYSDKNKNELSFYGKIYDADVAFNSLHINTRYDLDHNLENIVYNELLFMGYKLNVYEASNKEIDFIAIKNNKIFLIQVAYSVVDEKAYEREFGAFSSIDNSNQKIIITNDDLDFSTSTVKHIKFKDFLLMKEL